MKSRGLRVPRDRGEEARRELVDSGLLRADLEIIEDGAELVLPLSETAGDLPTSWGRVVTQEFRARSGRGPQRYRDLLAWPEEEKELLPRSFDVVGDIVLIRLPESLEPRRNEVGEALLRFVPRARLVGMDRGVHGPERRRSVERIAGSGAWRTRHLENGVELEVDVELAYFSPRLAREHAAVAEDVAEQDRVYDLCCGVGPFSATIVRLGRASAVTAVDANPHAIDLLRTTLRRLPGGDRVRSIAGTIEGFLPLAPPVERVVLNLPHEGIKYLPSVARTVAPGGRLYYYEVTDRTDEVGRGGALEKMLVPAGEFRTVASRVVHPYSPGADLVAYVLERPR